MKPICFLISLLLLTSCDMNLKKRSSKFEPENYFSEVELPIARAIYNNDNTDLKNLLKKNHTVDISQPGMMGYTYLLYAMQNLNYDAMEILLKNGTDPNVGAPIIYVPGAGKQSQPSINTCIECTAYSKYDIKYLKLLVKYGANINDTQNTLALSRAIKYHQTEKIDYLLANGAKLNIIPNFGLTPIITAVGTTQWELVDRLLDLGADPFLKVDNFSVKRSIEYYMSSTKGTPGGNKELARLLKRLEKMGMEIDYSESKIKFEN